MKKIIIIFSLILSFHYTYSIESPLKKAIEKPLDLIEVSFTYNPFLWSNIPNDYYSYNDFNLQVSAYKKLSDRYLIGLAITPLNLYFEKFDEEAYANELFRDQVFTDQALIYSEEKTMFISHDLLFQNRILLSKPKDGKMSLYVNINGGIKVTSFVQTTTTKINSSEVDKYKLDAGNVLGVFDFKLGYRFVHLNVKQVLTFNGLNNYNKGIYFGGGLTFKL